MGCFSPLEGGGRRPRRQDLLTEVDQLRQFCVRPARGPSVRKRYSSNFSLWPERARPRRAIPLTRASGDLAIGIVCAVAVYIVVTGLYRSVSTQEVHVPIYATAPATVIAAESVGSITRTRSQRAVAKVGLPIMSRDTDGRGGGTPTGEPLPPH